jgi:hypothetical protein
MYATNRYFYRSAHIISFEWKLFVIMILKYIIKINYGDSRLKS